jgi:transcriptional regulator with XRE-family HTH domain
LPFLIKGQEHMSGRQTTCQESAHTGWTLEQFAEAAQMNELQIGHIERGASDPKLSTILKLAKALKIRPEELLRPFR